MDADLIVQIARARSWDDNLWANPIVEMRHKILYWTMPKAACTLMRRILQDAEGLQLPLEIGFLQTRLDTMCGYCHRLAHFTEERIAHILTAPDWWRFTMVRNPYSRMISAYQDKICDPDQDEHYAAIADRIREETETDGEIPFPVFARWAAALPDEERDFHWRTQTSLCLFGRIRYDWIGRFEEIDRTLRLLFLRCGKYRDNVYHRSTPHQTSRYDAELAGIVYRAYQADFENFGYDEESWQ